MTKTDAMSIYGPVTVFLELSGERSLPLGYLILIKLNILMTHTVLLVYICKWCSFRIINVIHD